MWQLEKLKLGDKLKLVTNDGGLNLEMAVQHNCSKEK